MRDLFMLRREVQVDSLYNQVLFCCCFVVDLLLLLFFVVLLLICCWFVVLCYFLIVLSIWCWVVVLMLSCCFDVELMFCFDVGKCSCIWQALPIYCIVLYCIVLYSLFLSERINNNSNYILNIIIIALSRLGFTWHGFQPLPVIGLI